MLIVEKAFAYVTHGRKLLVFRHVGAPEVGIQVPAGTIHPGEPPASAALREAREETGLDGLELVGELGRADFDMSAFGKAEVHRRYFFHIELMSVDAPPTWQHHEEDSSEGGGAPISFEFSWAQLPDRMPPLIAGHGAFISELVRMLQLDAEMPP